MNGWRCFRFFFIQKPIYIRHLQVCCSKWSIRHKTIDKFCSVCTLWSKFTSTLAFYFIRFSFVYTDFLSLFRFRLVDLRWLCSTELFTVFYLSFELFVHSSLSCITSVFNLILLSWFVVVLVCLSIGFFWGGPKHRALCLVETFSLIKGEKNKWPAFVAVFLLNLVCKRKKNLDGRREKKMTGNVFERDEQRNGIELNGIG